MTPTNHEVADHYARWQIQTAGLPKKICMLHVKCVEFVTMAQEESGQERRDLLNKAQNILAQLEAAVRVKDSIAQSMFYLYDYCYILLERADEIDLVNVIQVLSILRNTFQDLFRTL